MSRKKVTPQYIVKKYVQHIAGTFNIAGVYIFGSAARGEMKHDSDIDLIVISNDFRAVPFIRRAQLLNRARTGSSLTVPMDIIGLTPKEFRGFEKNESPHLRKIYREARRVV